MPARKVTVVHSALGGSCTYSTTCNYRVKFSQAVRTSDVTEALRRSFVPRRASLEEGLERRPFVPVHEPMPPQPEQQAARPRVHPVRVLVRHAPANHHAGATRLPRTQAAVDYRRLTEFRFLPRTYCTDGPRRGVRACVRGRRSERPQGRYPPGCHVATRARVAARLGKARLGA